MATSEEVRAAKKLLDDMHKKQFDGSIKPADLDQAQAIQLRGD